MIKETDELGNSTKYGYEIGRLLKQENADGGTLQKVYDLVGNVKKEIDENGNLFSYTGHVYDESIELYYAKARYYDPNRGGMISEDVAKNKFNWYTYCLNNPINRYDPSGMAYVLLNYIVKKIMEK